MASFPAFSGRTESRDLICIRHTNQNDKICKPIGLLKSFFFNFFLLRYSNSTYNTMLTVKTETNTKKKEKKNSTNTFSLQYLHSITMLKKKIKVNK